MIGERTGKQTYSLCLCAELALAFGMALCTALHWDKGVSLDFLLSFLVMVPLVVSDLAERELPWTLLLLLFFSFLHVALNALLSPQAQLGFDYWKKLMMFCCALLFFRSAAEGELDGLGRGFLTWVPLIIAALLAASYFLGGNTGRLAGRITLGYTNPNLAGMWLTHLLFYMVCVMVGKNSTSLKAAALILAGFCLVLLGKTYSRACFFAVALFGALLLLWPGFARPGLRRALLWGLALLPLTFSLCYLAALRTGWFSRLFSLLIREGKPLTSREKLWRAALESAARHPILGDYCGISNGTGTAQLHNTHLDVLCSYGLLPLALFIRFLYELLDTAGRRVRSFRQYAALCAFAGALGIGCFEAAMVAGSGGLYFLTGGFLLLAGDPEAGSGP